MITEFRGDYSFLSNFHPCWITYEGIEYPTSEHAYQASKTLRVMDRAMIARCTTPGRAKRAGGRLVLRDDWHDTNVRLRIMKDILTLKFNDLDLATKLIDTGNVGIVEGNRWHDNYWGRCTCPECKDIRSLNHLGTLLMGIRRELMDRFEDPYLLKTRKIISTVNE